MIKYRDGGTARFLLLQKERKGRKEGRNEGMNEASHLYFRYLSPKVEKDEM